jgi:phenylalanyl-tRNA synthetase beta chain
MVPRYRIDIIHPVDIAEEVALGYGIDKISPIYPVSKQPGMFNPFDEFLDKASDIMAGSGMIEQMTYELVDAESLYGSFGRLPTEEIAVENPRSKEHSILRDSLVPSLMTVLSRNVKEDYPQRLFEIGRVYGRTKDGVAESWNLGCLLIHSQASYTEAKMHLESFVRLMTGREVVTNQSSHWAFTEGRSAAVYVGKERVGIVGEVKPEVLEAFGLNLPVSGFEMGLSLLHKQLK